MKFLLLAFAGVLIGSRASADILYLNLNVASNEISAAHEAAAARGEKLWVFPEIDADLEKNIDAAYRKSEEAGQAFVYCQQAHAGDCQAQKENYEALSKELKRLIQPVELINGASFLKILTKLDRAKVNLQSLVISGHSGGDGYFAGLYGQLHRDEVTSAFANFPGLLRSLRSVLLWGCYSATLYSLENDWRKNFPAAKVFAGYQGRAPLGIRESSGRYLKSFLLHESALLDAKGMTALHSVFRDIDMVADLDGAAIVDDFYLTYDSATSVEEMFSRCQRFDEGLLANFICYEKGSPGCENPPPDHQGPLRSLYSFLQINRHCVPLLQQKYPELPSPEYLVRLIFLDSVKVNFASHYQSSFSDFTKSLKDLDLPVDIGLEQFVHSDRQKDVQAFSEETRIMDGRGLRDGSYIARPDWKDHQLIHSSLAALRLILGPSPFRGSTYNCVPFSWVDPGSSEHDNCGLSATLPVSPRPATMESWLEVVFYNSKEQENLVPGWSSAMSTAVVSEIRKNAVGQVAFAISALQALSDRTAVEERRLARYGQIQNETAGLDDRKFVEQLLLRVQQVSLALKQDLNQAQSDPFGKDATSHLTGMLKVAQTCEEHIHAALAEAR